MASILDSAALEFGHHSRALCRAVTGSETQDGEWMVQADGSRGQKLEAWTTVLAGVIEGSGGAQRHIENRISWPW